MAKVIGVRFKNVGKVYFFAPKDIELKKNDNVIVETVRGIELGKVVLEEKNIDEDELKAPLKDVIRKATFKDIEKALENREKEKVAQIECTKKIKEHNLNMKLIDVEYTFDNNKILFYFTADGRVDFRDLVKDLAGIFRTRIELRQIGVRDEAKMLGGIGMCGRPLCCNTFLGEFQPVSIKMAKEQNLSLNPAKISGICSRLMCCLRYEHEAYQDLHKKTPKVGALVKTDNGNGEVVSVSLLKGLLHIKFETGDQIEIKEYKVEDVIIVKRSFNNNNKKNNRNNNNNSNNNSSNNNNKNNNNKNSNNNNSNNNNSNNNNSNKDISKDIKKDINIGNNNKVKEKEMPTNEEKKVED